MKKSLFAVVFLVASASILRVHAKTVAWWPLAAEEGAHDDGDDPRQQGCPRHA